MDIDELDQNAPKNVAGSVIGEYSGRKEQISATESLQPYNEVRCCKLVGPQRAVLIGRHEHQIGVVRTRCPNQARNRDPTSDLIVPDVCRCSAWTASGSVS